jgi:uncharacterized membrane protein
VIHSGRWDDERVARWTGNLLRFGVGLAAAMVTVGGVLYLARHGREPAGYQVFQGEPPRFRSLTSVLRPALGLSGRAIIQLGLLVLIATPVARVAFSLVAFALQRDRTYMVVSVIVLAALLYSLGAG